MRKINLLVLVSSASLALTSCGFSLPNQANISESITSINLCGDYHDKFYKYVKRDLTTNGVIVHDSCSNDINTPQLVLPNIQTNEYIASVDSKAQVIEYDIIVQSNATLYIANHRPIVINNSITRTVLNKTGHSLSSENEKRILIDETSQELASQLVMRLNYLGRLSDPNAYTPMPQELVYSQEETDKTATVIDSNQKLTLIEALRQADRNDQNQGVVVDFETLNNGHDILEQKLPKVEAKLLD